MWTPINSSINSSFVSGYERICRQGSKGEDWGKQACRPDCHKQGYRNKTGKRVTSKTASDCHSSDMDLVQIAKGKKNHRRKTVVATARVQRETLKKFPGGDKYRMGINPKPKVWQLPSLVHFDSSTLSTTASFYAHWVKVSFFFSYVSRGPRGTVTAQPSRLPHHQPAEQPSAPTQHHRHWPCQSFSEARICLTEH